MLDTRGGWPYLTQAESSYRKETPTLCPEPQTHSPLEQPVALSKSLPPHVSRSWEQGGANCW